jgi:hypothetical protein
MINKSKQFLRLLFLTITMIVSSNAVAGPVTITDISPLPSQASVNSGPYYGTYLLTARPNRTIVFKNRFPHSVEQITGGGYCEAKNKMPASGQCTIRLKFQAPPYVGHVNPTIRACIDGMPLCTQHKIAVQVVSTPTPVPAPTVTGVSPTSGPTAEGTSVTITGNSFTEATVVKFGATAAPSFTVNNPNQITAIAPGGVAGTTVDITVTTPRGTSAVSTADHFTYVSPPIIDSFTANPATITQGRTAFLNPVFSGGSGSIDNGVGPVTSGASYPVSPISTTTYTLTVTNSIGAVVTRTVTVTVVPAPVITSFIANPTTITQSDTANLTPTFSGGSGNIDNGVGPVTSGASYPVSPTSTTTYTLTVTNSIGAVVTEIVTVTVVAKKVATPTLFPLGGAYQSGQPVVISCSTAGAVIHYTTDGTTPTVLSPEYHLAPITVSTSMTIKAIGMKNDYVDSDVASQTYIIGLSFDTITISGVNGYEVSIGTAYTATDITIPNTYNGLPVLKIKDGGFAGSKITNITMSNNTVEIGNNAFTSCTNLSDVTIPSSVTSIDNFAFSGCTGLTSLTIPSSVTSIGAQAFADCSSLNEVYAEPTIPPVVGAGDMFQNHSPLLVIYVPNSSLTMYKIASGWSNYSSIMQ